jgi:hypothetical protein
MSALEMPTRFRDAVIAVELAPSVMDSTSARDPSLLKYLACRTACRQKVAS